MRNMIVSDYDQTFYLNNLDIEINKNWIMEFKKKNNIFVIATGRSYYDFQNQLNRHLFYYDYVILNHGATIMDHQDNILFNLAIENDILPTLQKTLQLQNCVSYFCCSERNSRCDFTYQNLTKINVEYSTQKEAFNMANHINKIYGKYVTAYYISMHSIEIVSHKINKALAIYKVMEICDIKKDHVYTIGDGYSDIPMIKEFHGYSMKNAIEELKEVAISEVNSVSELIQLVMNKD